MPPVGHRPSHPLYHLDAGNHPLPSDRRSIEAVLRSARRCYALHPYFAARYGERGEAFARSDGGYLVTLVEHPQNYVNDQIRWLAEVLANRGMPRWLMESHLDILHDELRIAHPMATAKYDKLRQVSVALAEARRARIPQDRFELLAAEFDADAGGSLANMGGTIVSAVCDQACGLTNALPSLLRWAADPARFPDRWCNAVAYTVDRAGALLATPGG